jgi:hypothetical protein
MKPKSPKFGYVANLGMFLFVPWNHGEKAEEGREGGRGRGQQRLARGTGSLRKLLACEGEREEAAVLCTTCMQASVCNVFAG